MAGVKNFSDQVLNVWRGSTPAARVGLVLLVLLSATLVTGVGYWSMQPYFVTLASDLQPETMTALMAELDKQNIAYEIGGGGNVLKVDKRNWSRAQVLARSVGAETSGSAVETLSPLDNALNRPSVERRNLEKLVSQAIGQIKAVEQATVLLNIPENHPFLRNRSEPSASVVLTLRKNEPFGELQANAIAELVANSVQGLVPQRVAITDTEGKKYTVSDEDNMALTRQDEYRIQRERDLSDRARTMLARSLGHENVAVSVAAEFEFPDKERNAVTYDASNKAVSSEMLKSSKTTGQDQFSAGAAGAASNINSNIAPPGSGPVTLNVTEDSETKYDNSKITETQRERTPRLLKLTVSVVVNSKGLTDDAGAVPPAIQESFEEIVKNAIGFQEERDQIAVKFLEFKDPLAEVGTPASGIPWPQINEILRNVSLAVGALVAFVIAWLVLGRIKSNPSLAASTAAPAAATSRLEDLGKLAGENPEVFARIIAAWANSSAGSNENRGNEAERKAA